MMRPLRFLRHRDPGPPWEGTVEERSHHVGPERRAAFRALGCRSGRRFFPHRVLYLRRMGPDGLHLARKMAGVRDPDALWLVTIHAMGKPLEDLPPELFEDDDVVWHRQGLGVPGHVAFALVAVRGRSLHVLGAVSDLVQRISRRPAVRSRVENRFGGWSVVLLNAVVHLAGLLEMRTVRTPSADLVLAHTDPERTPGRALFERIYDRTPPLGWKTRRNGDWWEIPLAENRARVVEPEPRTETRRREPTLCLLHDVERGLGHRDVDPAFARAAEARGWEPLDRILRVESDAAVRGTYAVVGALLPEVRERIERRGHEVAFHSFDHGPGRQLLRCRRVDYRIEGYRAPRSRLTRELRGRPLRLRNFQWLASSEASLGTRLPVRRSGVVMVPVVTDDFPLHTGALEPDAWEEALVREVERRPFSTLSLHDCYAHLWIDRYPRLLERLAERVAIRRVGDVVDELFRAEAL